MKLEQDSREPPYHCCHKVRMHSFPGGSEVKASACNAGDLGLIPGWEDPLEKEMATRSSFLPGESHGWRSLEGYSPRGYKELGMTE